MKSIDAKKLLDQIDVTINDINSFVSASALEKSYLAKYLTVFISGIYEEAIETIVNEMAQKNSTPDIASYIAKTMEAYFRNPNMNRICECLKKFNVHWANAIRNLPLQERQALDSIVNNKNAIAHGRHVVIPLSDIIQYYNDSRSVIIAIDSMLL